MNTIREEVKDLADKLPENASWDDVMYEIYVRRKIAAGIQAADEGRVVDHKEVKRQLCR